MRVRTCSIVASRIISALALTAIVACAQLQGLGSYEKVDCVGDACGAAPSCAFPIETDPDHCGDCAKACSGTNIDTRTCAAGACTGACKPGFEDCNADKQTDGCETSTMSSPDACGACGKTCSSQNVMTKACENGACSGICAPGFGDCNNDKLTDGCETALLANTKACGQCGRVCSANNVPVPACAGGTCTGTCAAGYDDCNADRATDGCETNIKNDTMHCSTCKVPCPSTNRKCDNGTCAAGYGVTRGTQPFIDACALPGMGRFLNQAEDDAWVPAVGQAGSAMPFPFAFYGTNQPTYWVQANGALSFTPPVEDFPDCPLPALSYGAAIFAFGDDLQSRNGLDKGVCIGQTTDAAPNRKLVITWQDARLEYDATTHLTFSLILNETNTIDVVFKTVTSDGTPSWKGGDDAAVGLQSATRNTPGAMATAFSCAQPVIESGLSIRFIPSAP